MSETTDLERDDAGLVVGPERAGRLKAASHDWVSWDLDERQLCDLEMLASGAFAPLTGYVGEADHAAVVQTGRLADGTLWPVPVSLAVDRAFADGLADGDHVALRDPEGTMLAVLTVSSRFTPTATGDGTDPATGGDDTGAGGDPVCLGGPVEAIQLPNQYDFPDLRRTPAEARRAVRGSGHARVLATTTWQPLLSADLGELKRLVNTMGARVLVQAVVGELPTGTAAPLDRFSLVRALQAALAELPDAASVLTLVPMAPGPGQDPARQALLDALVARAHGATHVWAPRDPDAASALEEHADEIGLSVVARPPTSSTGTLTVDEVQRRLADGGSVPDGVAPPAVMTELRRAVPPRHQRGFTVFFTGLSGSGKSTVANIVATRLRASGSGRKVTLLDGDLVRRNLSSELGFSREHRNVNVLRIGYVASEITKHGGIAVCAPIAPYDRIRKENRRAIEATGGGYVLVHVSTPLEVCEARDRKGLYAKARAGVITEFTGISDPYEEPDDADLAVDTTDITPTEAADQVLAHLREAGWLAD